MLGVINMKGWRSKRHFLEYSLCHKYKKKQIQNEYEWIYSTVHEECDLTFYLNNQKIGRINEAMLARLQTTVCGL